MIKIKQMHYLQEKHSEGMRPENAGRARGTAAAHLRLLRSYMKLDELFTMNNRFMNVELREFLNLNENGTDMYTWNDVHQTGWREVLSLGSQMHQLTAPDTKVSILVGYAQNGFPLYQEIYNRLNAKFCHEDGREVVFSFHREIITVYPDKGTFNYGDDLGNDIMMGAGSIKIEPIIEGDHYKYDMEPYNEYINQLKNNNIDFKRNIEELTRQNGGNKSNTGIEGNSYFWRFNENSFP